MKLPSFAAAMHDTDYDLPNLIPPQTAFELVDPFDRPCESLNGQWHFALDPYDMGLRKKWYLSSSSAGNRPVDFDFDAWNLITVPACYNTQRPEYMYYEGTAWYTRTFPFEHGPDGERVFLLFEGALGECRIWMNDVYLARHVGGSTPFSVDVTQHLQPLNRLVVLVNNRRRRQGVPALHTDWFNYGGLYRDVSLFRVPQNHIKKAFVRLVPDGRFQTVRVDVQTAGNAEWCHVSIPELNIDTTLLIRENRGSISFSAQPQLWCPEAPKTYAVILEYDQDRVCEEVGLREVRVDGRRFFLNGKPIFLRGISFHEDHPTACRALTDGQIENLFYLTKELGCNFVRLAHYPHSRLASKAADRLGLMLWEEIPVYWAIDFDSPAARMDACNQLRELIHRDRNRASVCIWSVGNENPDTDSRLHFMEQLVAICHSEDDTRPVAASCLVNYETYRVEDRLAAVVDIVGINEYFGWYRGNARQLGALLEQYRLEKPLLLSELGAGALYGKHGSVQELFTEECQDAFYQAQLETIGNNLERLCGMSPWILFDFRSPGRLNAFQMGYNRKGLVSEDHLERKKAFFTLQAFYEQLSRPSVSNPPSDSTCIAKGEQLV